MQFLQLLLLLLYHKHYLALFILQAHSSFHSATPHSTVGKVPTFLLIKMCNFAFAKIKKKSTFWGMPKFV